MTPRILLAAHDRELRDALAAQLAADGHDALTAPHSRTATATLADYRVDVLVLGALEDPHTALGLLRTLRDGTLTTRVAPELPVVTLAPLAAGDDEQLDTLRAYDAGSDHHLPAGADYLHLLAVLTALARRAHRDTRRVFRVGAIEVDTTAREVRVAGTPIETSAKEFALIARLASQPGRVFTKDELLRDIWGYPAGARTRTLDGHATRARRKLAEHGARAIINIWGVGYRFTDESPRP